MAESKKHIADAEKNIEEAKLLVCSVQGVQRVILYFDSFLSFIFHSLPQESKN